MYYGYGPFYDPTFIFLIPAIIIAFAAQLWVKSAFDRYSRVPSARGSSADAVARALLDRGGLHGVPIVCVQGSLTDHYDPVKRVLSLSQSVYGSSSIAAIGVAAHEVGHALQHQESYAPLMMRNAIVPVASLCSGAGPLLFFLGLIMSIPGLVTVGIVFFCGVIVFHIVTLPVELNASSRALRLLEETGYLSQSEIGGARSVLRAAAMTYIAAVITSIANLLRLLAIANSSRRRR